MLVNILQPKPAQQGGFAPPQGAPALPQPLAAWAAVGAGMERITGKANTAGKYFRTRSLRETFIVKIVSLPPSSK
jgi:hypothetical protein